MACVALETKIGLDYRTRERRAVIDVNIEAECYSNPRTAFSFSTEVVTDRVVGRFFILGLSSGST